ncbi:TPA: phage protein NinX family protein, partial [Morganella morganii]
AVAEITIYGDWYLSPTDEQPFTFFNYGINSSKTVELPDYCNNPADAYPIIFENKININFRESIKTGVMAELSGWSGVYSINENPLRAAMEVFLMMKDVENEKVDGSAEIK